MIDDAQRQEMALRQAEGMRAMSEEEMARRQLEAVKGMYNAWLTPIYDSRIANMRSNITETINDR